MIIVNSPDGFASNKIPIKEIIEVIDSIFLWNIRVPYEAKQRVMIVETIDFLFAQPSWKVSANKSLGFQI